jgi:cytochrome P450
MEPTITEVGLRLLEGVKADLKAHGQTDILRTFTVGLPMTIIAIALGVAGEDLATFKRWSDDIVMPVGNHSPSVEQVRGFLISTKEFTEYFLAQIAARKAQPTGDLLCDIANAKIDGEELTDDEQLGMLQQFLVAGNETTTNLISNMIRCLAENPELQDRIRQNPELIEPFVEEMLRSEAPVGGLFRQAKVDVDIAGTTIPAGDHMWLVFASANRDECKFSGPDAIDPERANVKDHLAFGNGEHFCPGAGLARAEARIALQLVLEHLDDIKLTADNDFPYGDSFVLRGLTSLKITAKPKI